LCHAYGPIKTSTSSDNEKQVHNLSVAYGTGSSNDYKAQNQSVQWMR
jgi:hypothetical protein